MKYTRVGDSGLQVSRICLGALSFGDPAIRPWTLSEDDSRTIIKAALDSGITFFDTADSYCLGRSEEILGRAIGDFSRREDIVIATKVGLPTGDKPNEKGLSRRHILRSIDRSLERLRTDYVDVYYIHRWDYDTPIEETLDTLADVVRTGKARYLAASSMFAWQFSSLIYHAKYRHRIPFIAMQAQYNLAYREEEFEMTPLCLAEGVGMVPWSPLARGFLGGSRTRSGPGSTIRSQTDDLEQKRYHREADFQVLDALLAVAGERALPPAQVAVAWLLSKPVVTAPVIGITKLDQLKDAVAAVDVSLTPEEVARLEAPYCRRTINDHS